MGNEYTSEQDLTNLIQNEVIENQTLEYKKAISLDQKLAKTEFLRDVSSFANAVGGHLIIGIDEVDGKPASVSPVSNVSAEDLIQQIKQLCSAHIEPKLVGIQYQPINIQGGFVLVMWIPKTWSGPHMVKMEEDRFWVRHANGKERMTVPELRASYLLSQSVAERMRSFRVRRLASIVAEETPIPLIGDAKVVLHILPLSAFDQTSEVDISKFDQGPLVARPMHLERWSSGFNFDGHYAGSLETHVASTDYIQVFRNGCIELANTSLLLPHREQKLFTRTLEITLAKALSESLSLLANLGLGPPAFGMVSLLNVRGYSMEIDPRFQTSYGRRCDRQQILLPDFEIKEFLHPASHILLKQSSEILWQSCGYARSLHYDAAGNWKKDL
jgi:hypothetical protein